MLTQALPPSARDYARYQRRESVAAVEAVRRQWRRMGDDFDASWALIAPSVVAITETAQLRIAASARDYIPAVLEDTGQTRAVPALAQTNAEGFVGWTGAGVAVSVSLSLVTIRAKQAMSRLASERPAGADARTGEIFPASYVPGDPAVALHAAGKWLTNSVGTILSDTARQVEKTGMYTRPHVRRYVRMLNPPSCSRCVILAGATYWDNDGFERHPGCECRHIPVAEAVSGDLLLDPAAYFESRTEEEQDRVFTKAGAQAIRDGAHVGDVVNARKGMTTSQSREPGQSARLIRNEDGLYTTTSGLGRRRQGIRLMPESIYEIARGDQSEVLRLLRQYNYIRTPA